MFYTPRLESSSMQLLPYLSTKPYYLGMLKLSGLGVLIMSMPTLSYTRLVMSITIYYSTYI
jgi:hypothetical protein